MFQAVIGPDSSRHLAPSQSIPAMKTASFLMLPEGAPGRSLIGELQFRVPGVASEEKLTLIG